VCVAVCYIKSVPREIVQAHRHTGFLRALALQSAVQQPLACPMSQHAPTAPAERSSMELTGSATDAAASDAGAASAAAALAGLSAESACGCRCGSVRGSYGGTTTTYYLHC